MKNKFRSRVPWREKIEKPQEPKLVRVPPKTSQFGKGMMLNPTPNLVDEIVRQVARGRLVTCDVKGFQLPIRANEPWLRILISVSPF